MIKRLFAITLLLSSLFSPLCYANGTSVVINGHALPPEPDPKINNATLLGIDSNHNGVRDDVERKIYFIYKRPIIQAYMMQFAQRFQKQLINPEQSAISEQTERAAWNQYSCEGYLSRSYHIKLPWDAVDFIENNFINTRERLEDYMKFNVASSGRNFQMPVHSKDLKAENCDFNITLMLEMEQKGGK